MESASLTDPGRSRMVPDMKAGVSKAAAASVGRVGPAGRGVVVVTASGVKAKSDPRCTAAGSGVIWGERGRVVQSTGDR